MEPTDLSRYWGQRLRERRQANGLTPTSLATACGLSRQSIHNYENGSRVPGVEHRVSLARALETRAAELFPYPDEEDAA